MISHKLHANFSKAFQHEKARCFFIGVHAGGFISYHGLAKFWMMAGDSANAVNAEATAIDLLKKEPDVSQAKIAGYLILLTSISKYI